MTQKKDQFSKGDWIVHLHYGVGQIKSIEKKQIGDEKLSYYRVITDDSTFWVPTVSPDEERVRSVASKYKMRKALAVFKESHIPLAEDHNERKRQINEAMTQIELETSAILIRDLTAHQTVKKLNPSEEKALEKFVNNFVLEWSISMEMDIEKANEKFQSITEDLLVRAAKLNN